MNISLVCIAKNEENYIDEWIEYHIKLGFSKIIIYQNDWRYIGKYKNEKFIQLIEYDGENKQLDAYNHFIQNYYNDYDWAGFIDIDEFVVLKKTLNISDFLNDYNDFCSLGLNWSMFGSNDLEFNGEYSVLKRFKKCRQELIGEIKCFINFNKSKNLLSFESPHNISQIDKTISVDKSHFINTYYDFNNKNNREIAYINHYYIKTKKEWEQKISRGWPIPSPQQLNYGDLLFNKRNGPEYSEFEDLTAYNFMYYEKNKNCSTSLICLNQTMIHSIVSDIYNLGLKYRKYNYNWFHADFMDGHFVPRFGIAPELIQHLKDAYGSYIIIDSHMMIEDPYTYADVVAPYSDYYMFHVEAVTDPMRTIQKIRKNWPKVKVGLYFNLSTDILQYKNILHEIDCIGLMGISPGVLGTNSYFDIVYNKIVSYNEYKKLANNNKLPDEIFIDGSVNFKTIPKYFEIGATTLVCGSSSIANNLSESTYEKNIKKIEESN